MTLAFFLGLVAACVGLPYLWRSHREDIWRLRYDIWCWLAWYAGQRAGSLVDAERERRQAALAGEHLIDEIEARWLTR